MRAYEPIGARASLQTRSGSDACDFFQTLPPRLGRHFDGCSDGLTMAADLKYCCARISQKWVFAIMGFFAIFCAFAMRMCLSLTIEKMVTHHKTEELNFDESCPGSNYTVSSTESQKNMTGHNLDTYEWSEYTQGIILGSFYWGFVASHVPGGILAERFGGKHTLGLGMLLTAIFTILTPAVISWGGSTALIGLRVLMGLFEGTVQPAMSAMLAQWVPASERSKISTLVYMGATFGILFISLALAPVMASMDWPGVYYTFGGVGVVWYVFWCLLCHSSPRDHPFISDQEASKLAAKLGEHTHEEAPPVPWRHLLTSAPFWALVVASVGRDWGGYTMMADIPKFNMGVLKLTPEENGYTFLVMNVAIITSCMMFSWLGDWMIKHKYASITVVRKVLGTVGMSLHGLVSVLYVYIGCDKKLYYITTFVSSFFAGAAFPGVKANVLDLSPNYAGTVMAVSHGLAGLCGIGGPYVVGVLVPNQTLSEWRLVFWIIAVVNIVSNLVYVLFASGEVQEWNDPNFERNKKKKMKEQNIMREGEKLLTPEKIQIGPANGTKVSSVK